MRYFGGCDVGSTYTKCVILDENGNMVEIENIYYLNILQQS